MGNFIVISKKQCSHYWLRYGLLLLVTKMDSEWTQLTWADLGLTPPNIPVNIIIVHLFMSPFQKHPLNIYSELFSYKSEMIQSH